MSGLLPHQRRVHPAIVELCRRADNFVPDQLAQHPAHIARALHSRFLRTRDRDGRPQACRELREYTDATRYMLPANAGEETLRGWARARARECRLFMARHDDPDAQYAAGYTMVRQWGLTPPEPAGEITTAGCIARMRCERWWRRQVRVAHGRRLEREARALGLVHKRAGLYVSEDAFGRWHGRQRTNALTLADTEAICEDTGEALNLAEIAASGPANPKHRRAELMVRVRGLEEVAQRRGDVGLFVTWTVPPELHAVDSRSCTPGEGARVTPREAQGWLRDQWARARAELHRQAIQVYGLRVAEPHHDGTPHWHLLLWVPEGQAPTLRKVLREYVTAGDTRPDRRRHAQKCIEIDRNRGSAAGYVAKYVAKAVDGHALDGVVTRDADGREVWLDRDPADAASRVRAWASTWGIRQFQFFGCPPVTVWRELRRLDRITTSRTAEAIRAAADAGEWDRYVRLMGGPCVPRDARPARCRYMADSGTGRYGEPRKKIFVECDGRPYVTRPLSWVIEYRPGGCGNEATESRAGAVARGAGISDRHGKGVDRSALHAIPEHSGCLCKAEGAAQRGHAVYPGVSAENQGMAPAAGKVELLERGREACAPWTRGNNCTEVRARGPDERDSGGGIRVRAGRPPPAD